MPVFVLRSILCFFLVFSGTAARAADAPVILIWGDSLSAGYGLNPGESWPSLLQTHLTQQGFPHRVVNASVSGETSSGGRSRLPEILAREQPALVLLALGANDGLRGLPLAMLRENLAAMVDMVQAAGARPMLLGMQMPPNYGPAYTRAFAAAFSDLAAARELPIVPFLLEGFAADPTAFQADGIHPLASAQPRILDTVWAQLETLLER